MQLLCCLFVIFNAGICLGAPMEKLFKLDSDAKISDGHFLPDINRNGLRNENTRWPTIFSPTKQQAWVTDPEFTDGFFEGDIILDIKRNGVNDPNRYWPNGVVYYTIDSIFDDEHRAAIRTAMDTIEAPTCVRFEEVTSSEQLHYVNITGSSSGCNAHIGNLRRVQKLNLQLFPLGTGCFIMGKLIHELLHVLGFFHMQSDTSRDDYVIILKENIQKGYEYAFQKRFLDDFDVEYDYASMMHYPPNAYSKNDLPTIVALQALPPGLMGQRVAMTPSDILRINRMYRCLEVTSTTKSITTENTTENITGNTTESTTEKIP